MKVVQFDVDIKRLMFPDALKMLGHQLYFQPCDKAKLKSTGMLRQTILVS